MVSYNVFLSFYATFYACLHYLYNYIHKFSSSDHKCPAHLSVIGGVFLLESIVWCTQIVCYPEFGGCLLFRSSKCIASTGIAVGIYIGCCPLDVRHFKCPLTEVPLYNYACLFMCVCAHKSYNYNHLCITIVCNAFITSNFPYMFYIIHAHTCMNTH